MLQTIFRLQEAKKRKYTSFSSNPHKIFYRRAEISCLTATPKLQDSLNLANVTSSIQLIYYQRVNCKAQI